jgi:hypothetical protein
MGTAVEAALQQSSMDVPNLTMIVLLSFAGIK